jgi:hypothetical protein
VRRAVAAALACGALAGLIGCGAAATPQEGNRYTAAVNRAQNDFAARLRTLSGRISETSTATQDQRTLGEVEQAVEQVVDRLRAIRPPQRIAPLHSAFIAQLGAYGRAVDRVRPAFGSADARRSGAAQRSLREAFTRVGAQINRTVVRLNRALRGS